MLLRGSISVDFNESCSDSRELRDSLLSTVSLLSLASSNDSSTFTFGLGPGFFLAGFVSTSLSAVTAGSTSAS